MAVVPQHLLNAYEWPQGEIQNRLREDIQVSNSQRKAKGKTLRNRYACISDRIHGHGRFTAKTTMSCPRPHGNIQRETKKRGRREDFGHWGSLSFVMPGSWVLDRNPSQTLNAKTLNPVWATCVFFFGRFTRHVPQESPPRK